MHGRFENTWKATPKFMVASMDIKASLPLTAATVTDQFQPFLKHADGATAHSPSRTGSGMGGGWKPCLISCWGTEIEINYLGEPYRAQKAACGSHNS